MLLLNACFFFLKILETFRVHTANNNKHLGCIFSRTLFYK